MYRYLAALWAVASIHASIFEYATTDVQLLYGNRFDGGTYVFDTVDGDKSTLTVEHYHVWTYGDNYMFFDRTEGNHYSGDDAILYGEWAPRLNIGRITGWQLPKDALVKALYLSGQVTMDENGYRAYLYGCGADLNVKGFDVLGVNAYRKEQNFSNDTWQMTVNWKVSLPQELLFTGFVDWTGEDLLTQPQLLYRLPFDTFSAATHIGIEWHYYRQKSTSLTSNAPQIMLQLTW